MKLSDGWKVARHEIRTMQTGTPEPRTIPHVGHLAQRPPARRLDGGWRVGRGAAAVRGGPRLDVAAPPPPLCGAQAGRPAVWYTRPHVCGPIVTSGKFELCIFLCGICAAAGNVSEGEAHCNASVASKRTAIGLAVAGASPLDKF